MPRIMPRAVDCSGRTRVWGIGTVEGDDEPPLVLLNCLVGHRLRSCSGQKKINLRFKSNACIARVVQDKRPLSTDAIDGLVTWSLQGLDTSKRKYSHDTRKGILK